MSLIAPAYGKINLALYVLGKRPDGYHDIATVMQAVTTHDLLTFTLDSDDVVLSCSRSDLECGDSNLVVRAVRSLEQDVGRKLPVRIELEKKLPVGAGMGGGSSDAATTLWALNELYQLGRSESDLRRLAAFLGADVPFFLSSGQALAEGRGERLTPLDWPMDYDVLLAFPGFPVATSEAYRGTNLRLTNPLADCRFDRQLAPKKFWGWIESQGNDLAAVVTAAYPAVARGIEAMRSLGARFAGMTGSGSAVFGLFDRPLTAREGESWPLDASWSVWPARPHVTPGRWLPAAGKESSGGL